MKYGKRVAFLLVLLSFTAAACVPITQPEPDRPDLGPTPLQPVLETPFVPLQTPTLPVETPAIPATGEFYILDMLVNDLTAGGLDPVVRGSVRQPFFDVTARVLSVNGQDIQVFEFPDPQARRAAENTISATGEVIGAFQPAWLDVPNFWSQGSVLVLYIGQDFETIQRLDQLLGERVSAGPVEDAVLPVTGSEAQRFLAERLGIDISRVQLQSIRPVQWPDACLGLPVEGELCAQVITPGFQVILQVDDRQYEVRTDNTGNVIRLGQRVQ
jgi:hypothetical protein